MADKWVKRDSQFANTPQGRVTAGIVKQKEDKKAEEKFKTKVVPAKAKDKLSNKRH
jgi:hypothetical protein